MEYETTTTRSQANAQDFTDKTKGRVCCQHPKPILQEAAEPGGLKQNHAESRVVATLVGSSRGPPRNGVHMVGGGSCDEFFVNPAWFRPQSCGQENILEMSVSPQ